MTKSELLKVIRAHCLDCCCGEVGEVKQCGCPNCNLYPYRFGKDPTKKELSPAQVEEYKKNLLNFGKKSAKTSDLEVLADATGT